jgi:hypothetical protein
MITLNWRLMAATSLLALTAAPAAAQVADERILEGADILADEATQDRLARTMRAMTRALLAMPVGPLAEAVREIDPDSPMAAMPADTRLADLAGDDAEDLPDRLAGQSRVMMRSMGTLARQLAVMAPVLRDMASDMAAQMERGMRDAREDSRRRR